MDKMISGETKNTVRGVLKKLAREAPLKAGVYIMKDAEGRIIYVGKAKILRNRLSSYFSGEKDVKTAILVSRAAAIETIITADEYEALLLENTLIKQHNPKYNIDLKDGKTYPVVRITNEEFPRVFRTRCIVEDGSAYFGPFTNAGAVDDMLDIIARNFPLRKCRVVKNRASPCMYYHIDRCAAPCCGKIAKTGYAVHVDRVRKLLAGETAPLVAELTAAMNGEAAALHFERAARFRNAIRAIEGLSGASAVVDFDPSGRDYIAWASEGVLATWSVFSMREGKLTGRELYRTRSASDDEESLETFIASYYNSVRRPPARIFIYEGGKSPPSLQPPPQASGLSAAFSAVPLRASRPAALNYIRRWFHETFGLDPELAFCPLPDDPASAAEGVRHHAAIIAMVRQNAAEDLARRLRERGAGPALDELAAALGLSARPETIEGFDIAQLDGKHPVASLISFKNGVPDRKNYRHFKLRSVIGVVDDFASMREAVRRRYSRLLREGRELPDLILIDGGAGQVNAAQGVLGDLGIDCGIAGLAKREEEIWLPGAAEPLVLSRRSEALKILQHVRDETHRFATGLNQKLRSKDLRLDALQSVEGIGPARAAALLKAFGSIAGIAAALPENIAASGSVSLAAARAARAVCALALARRDVPLKGRLGGAAALAEEALDTAGMAADPEEEYR